VAKHGIMMVAVITLVEKKSGASVFSQPRANEKKLIVLNRLIYMNFSSIIILIHESTSVVSNLFGGSCHRRIQKLPKEFSDPLGHFSFKAFLPVDFEVHFITMLYEIIS
jgi:hypothetical protein